MDMYWIAGGFLVAIAVGIAVIVLVNAGVFENVRQRDDFYD